MRSPTRIATAIESGAPTTLYHACTAKQLERYFKTGGILPPVRGFDTHAAAMIWASSVGRSHVVTIDVELTQGLPDHHHQTGLAWWSPRMAKVRWKTITNVPVDFHVWGLREIRKAKGGNDHDRP